MSVGVGVGVVVVGACDPGGYVPLCLSSVLKVNTCILERMSMFSMCIVLRESGDLRVSVHLKDKTSKTGGPTFPIVADLLTCTAKLLEGCPARVIRTRLTSLPENIYLWICNFCFTAINPEEAK